ncbi:hypothetical protein PHLGIDRAFT_449523 [Phlebiopsis gigantea 11061_1 CR5-6]|uniref:Uncharacterized protein n=1 Tax=Phlebiopsis gigantea (strain 11061_1 CR5-6) TaxID=745531 RepID=A0A0C3SA05_PHLG1|nr:hypothetical protein PHLGIDRAFT_449523 [Phlebiopsis gigantea 11061_1 CR5-6]
MVMKSALGEIAQTIRMIRETLPPQTPRPSAGAMSPNPITAVRMVLKSPPVVSTPTTKISEMSLLLAPAAMTTLIQVLMSTLVKSVSRSPPVALTTTKTAEKTSLPPPPPLCLNVHIGHGAVWMSPPMVPMAQNAATVTLPPIAAVVTALALAFDIHICQDSFEIIAVLNSAPRPRGYHSICP